MSGYGTSLEQMQQSGQKVLDVNNNVQGNLAQLRSQLMSLQGAWEGQGAMAFRNLMERWDNNARKLNTALEGIGEQVLSAGRTYQSSEEEASSQIGRIDTGGGGGLNFE